MGRRKLEGILRKFNAIVKEIQEGKEYSEVLFEVKASDRVSWEVLAMVGKDWSEVLYTRKKGECLTSLTWKEREVLNNFVKELRML